MAAAKSGDTVDVQAGTYTNDFVNVFKSITLQAVGGVVKMVATVAPPNGKAIIDEGGSGVNVTINGFDISGAKVADGNGAAVRYEGGTLTLNNDYIHNNQDGLLAASDLAGRSPSTIPSSPTMVRAMAIRTTSMSMTSPVSASRTATSMTPARATKSRAAPKTRRSPARGSTTTTAQPATASIFRMVAMPRSRTM